MNHYYHTNTKHGTESRICKSRLWVITCNEHSGMTASHTHTSRSQCFFEPQTAIFFNSQIFGSLKYTWENTTFENQRRPPKQNQDIERKYLQRTTWPCSEFYSRSEMMYQAAKLKTTTKLLARHYHTSVCLLCSSTRDSICDLKSRDWDVWFDNSASFVPTSSCNLRTESWPCATWDKADDICFSRSRQCAWESRREAESTSHLWA